MTYRTTTGRTGGTVATVYVCDLAGTGCWFVTYGSNRLRMGRKFTAGADLDALEVRDTYRAGLRVCSLADMREAMRWAWRRD